jgi:hypothetical protein
VNVAASKSMELPRQWARMNAEELRDLTATLAARLAEQDAVISRHEAERTADRAELASRNEELKHKQLRIDQLTHEMATSSAGGMVGTASSSIPAALVAG